MSGIPWMLVRLGLETATHHAQADDDRLAGMDVRSRADYRAFLERIYGFETPAEECIWRTRGLGLDILNGRNRAGRLREDLEALGATTNEIAALPIASISIRSIPQALGWLFVLERHTLLAGLIRRHVHRAAGEVVGGAFAYLSAYGDKPGARFRSLGDQLGAYAHRFAPDAIAAGANDAFRAERLWYSGTFTRRLLRPHESSVLMSAAGDGSV